MTPAEYRTIREACGLTVRDAAEFHAVSERTVVHWESGRNGIPTGAADELTLLNATIERAVSNAATVVGELARQHGDPDAIALVRYRTPESYATSRAAREGLPFACHGATIARTMIALERAGAKVTISWG